MSNEELLANKIEQYLESEQCKRETMYLSKDDLMLCMLALRLQEIDKTSVGVSDDVCEWKIDGVYIHSPHIQPLVTCIADDEDYRFNYCPVCGKKIKVVE